MMSLLSSRHIALLSVFQFLYRRHLITLQHRHRQLSKGNAVACTHGDSLRRDEGMFFDGGQNITKLDFCGEGVSMVDDWHSVWTIPAVHWK